MAALRRETGGEGQLLHGGGARPPFQVVGIGHRHLAVGLGGAVGADEEDLVALPVGKRVEQDGVDDAENRRRRANAEREHQRDGQRKARGLEHLAEGEAEVGEHGGIFD
jgi:hypothetical protein